MFKPARTLTLAALLLAATLAGTAAAQAAGQPTAQQRSAADATLQRLLARERFAILNGAPLHQAASQQHTTPTAASSDDQTLAGQLAAGRLATARYATSLHAAKAAGYQPLTRMIPDMGWHLLNPTIQGFDLRKPPILVYERHGRAWQLAAFEWVFPSKPASPPLPGATYGSFGAACHYQDGTFVFRPTQQACPARSPQSGARFTLWHPDLVTLHVWAWYPNPAGLYSGTNPNVTPFNHT